METNEEPKFSRTSGPDYKMVDEVVIKTIPRYKTSGLSGDEWRVCGHIEFKIKGKVIHERSLGDISIAMDFVKSEYWKLTDEGRSNIPYEEGFCDQAGCLNKWKYVYKLKHRFSRDSYEPRDAGTFYNHRAFCEKHKTRGDCALEDADRNYISVYTRPDIGEKTIAR